MAHLWETAEGVIKVAINPNAASKRTRNRVKESGPEFERFKSDARSGEVLLRSKKTGWFGWLPLNEIKVEEIK